MDDNTTKVVLTTIVLAFVVAIMWQFDRVSLHVERLRLDIFGLLKVSAGVLKVAIQRRQGAGRRRVNPSGALVLAAPFTQGSFALSDAIRVGPGEYDIDMIVVTHSDADHLNGLLRFLRRPRRGTG